MLIGVRDLFRDGKYDLIEVDLTGSIFEVDGEDYFAGFEYDVKKIHSTTGNGWVVF